MSVKHSFLYVVLLLALASAASIEEAKELNYPPNLNIFRGDYVFHQATGGWVKLHNVSASWHIARLACELEDAKLMSPLTRGLHWTMQQVLEHSSMKYAYTGIHGMAMGVDYLSLEGVNMNRMSLDWEEQKLEVNRNRSCIAMSDKGLVTEVNCDDELPFFCYKRKEFTLPINNCGTADPGYHRENATHGCYKFHSDHKATWYQAHTVCAAEGGHLAIINNPEEAEHLSQLTKGYIDYIYIGFFNWYRDDQFDINRWKTVDDRTLEQAGYANWMPGEPNNSNGDEFCGAIGWYEGEVGLNDVKCDDRLNFVCELPRPIAVPTED